MLIVCVSTGTVSTGFLDAIYKVFSDPAEAMMVKQSGIADGEIAKQFPDLQYGTDYDFFAFPGASTMPRRARLSLPGIPWHIIYDSSLSITDPDVSDDPVFALLENK